MHLFWCFENFKVTLVKQLIWPGSVGIIKHLISSNNQFIVYSGLILAIGQAMLLAASLAILPHYFSKKLSLANGITNAVASIMVVVLPIISSVILKRANGLQETWWFLAALNVLAAMLCLTYRSLLPNNNHETFVRRLKKSFGIKVFRKRNYNFWLLATFCGMFGYLIPIVNIVSFIFFVIQNFNYFLQGCNNDQTNIDAESCSEFNYTHLYMYKSILFI